MDSLPPESLLRHQDFVRRLARALLRDEHEADDAVQEVWLRALRRPPQAHRDPRPWLATVLRNVVASRSRSATRRRHHETAANTGPASATPPDEALSEVERQQHLLAALASLPSKQREALVECYLHGQTRDAAAKRLGVPLETLRTRLRRGLETLRRRLDDDFEGRQAWAAWLAPLAGIELSPPAGSPVASVPAGLPASLLVMLKTTATIAAIALPLVWFTQLNGENNPPRPTAGVSAPTLQTTQIPERPAEVAQSEPGATSIRRPVEGAIASSSAPGDLQLRFELVGPAGQLAAAPEGTLSLGGLDEEPIEITDGSATIAAGMRSRWIETVEQSAPELRLEGSLALFDATDRRRLATALRDRDLEQVSFESLRLLPVPVRVVDAESGRVLQKSCVRSDWGGSGVAPANQWAVPGETYEYGSSPIQVAARRARLASVWVGAEGYAWRRTSLDHAHGDEVTVALQRGGDVELRYGPEEPKGHWELAVRAIEDGAPTGPVTTIQPLGLGAPATLRGLPAGRWQAVAAVGDLAATKVVTLGSTEFEVTAGGTTQAFVELQVPSEDRTLVELSGEVLLPPELAGKVPAVRLRGVGDSLQRHASPARFELSMKSVLDGDLARGEFAFQVTPGPWLLVLDQCRWEIQVDVPAAGLSGVQLQPPPLTSVKLRFIDGTTGDGISPSFLMAVTTTQLANRKRANGTSSHGSPRIEPLEGAVGVFQFLAPQGRLSLYAPTAGYAQPILWLDVAGERSEQVIELFRDRWIEVRLIRDGEVLNWPAGATLRLAEHGSDLNREFAVTITPEGHARVQSPGPGRYRATVAGLLSEPRSTDLVVAGPGTVLVTLMIED